jgi:hypothetical protein
MLRSTTSGLDLVAERMDLEVDRVRLTDGELEVCDADAG